VRVLGTISDETCDVNWRLEAITVLHPSLDPHNCRAITTMRVEEKAFLRAAVTALPRITGIISGYAPDDRTGALEIAERRFIEAARDYGCTEIAVQSRVSVLMKRLRRQVERQCASEEQLRALLRSITKSD
jgi:hypothetical protein